jgi:G6PDH family F420-dependent oxidoreductase
MLEEAIEILRRLWTGELVSHRGLYFTVSNARIYTLPDEPPPIYVAAAGGQMADLAAEIGDGMIGTGPDVVGAYKKAGGTGPKIGQVTVCWAKSEAAARRTAREWWPTVAIHGEASQELPNPSHFEALVKDVTEADVAKMIPCGPDPAGVIEQIREYERGGYDRVYLHQVGPDQEGFLEFAARELLPVFETSGAGLAGADAGRKSSAGKTSRTQPRETATARKP